MSCGDCGEHICCGDGGEMVKRGRKSSTRRSQSEKHVNSVC